MTGSIISAKIVDPYAEALMSLAQSQNQTEQFGQDMRDLLGLLQNSPELGSFLGNPVVNPDDKKAVIRRLVGGETSANFVNFLLLLVERRRIAFLEGIANKYLELLRKQNNVVLANVTSAVELNDAQKEVVGNKVKSITGAQGVELTAKVDPDLIGGVIIKVGSQVYDASLRGQLRRLSLNLAKA